MSDTLALRDTDLPATTAARARRPLLLAAAALTALAAGATLANTWWTTGRFMESPDDSYIGGNITQISPHVAGFIASIAVTDNQFVRAGQLLIQLDRRDTEAAAAHMQAALDAATASLANLHAQYTLQQSAIAQSIADNQGKSARAAFARIDGTRYATLAVTNAGSRQDAQRAQAAAAEASAAYTAAQAGLQAAQQQLKVLTAQIAQANAMVAQATADLANARLRLGYTEIRAPIDGYIGNRAAQVGAYVQEGAYLLAVIPAHGLWVDANFKEDQLPRMHPGQPATIAVDAAPGVAFHGHVESLAPGTGAVFSVIPPENATGNFTKIVQRVPVRIALDAPSAMLRPGLSTIATVDTRSPN